MSFNLKDRVGSSRYTGLETAPPRAPLPNAVVVEPHHPYHPEDAGSSCGSAPSPRNSTSPRRSAQCRLQPASLEPAQTVVRNWDLDGDGVLSQPELVAAAQKLQSRERQVRSLKCIAVTAALALLGLMAAFFATVLAGTEIAKDMKPNTNGVLLDKRTLAPVATGQATVSHDVRSLVDAPQAVLQELKYVTLSTGGRLEHFRIDGWTLHTDAASGGNLLVVYTPRGVAIEISRDAVKLVALDPIAEGQKLTSGDSKFAVLDTTSTTSGGVAGSTATSTTSVSSGSTLAWTCAGYSPPVLPALSAAQWQSWGAGFQFPGDGSVVVSAGPATNFWDVAVLRAGVWLYPGFQYTLAFRASGSGALTAKAGWSHDPYLAHAETRFTGLTATPQLYRMTFTVTAGQPDNSANSVAFFFGHNAGTFTLSGVCIWATACQSSQTCFPTSTTTASASASSTSGTPTTAPASSRPKPSPSSFANLRGVAYGPWVNQYAQWPSAGMSGDLQLLWNAGVRAIRTYGSDSYNDLDKVPQAAYALGMTVFPSAALTCPLIPLAGNPARPCKPYQSCLALSSGGACPVGTTYNPTVCSAAGGGGPCDASAGACVPRDQSTAVCPAGTNDEELIQLNNAVSRAKQTSGVVIVGNEVLLNPSSPGGLNSTGLLLQLQWIRRQFGADVVLAYADSWYSVANPDGDTDGTAVTLTRAERQLLAAAVDVVLVHVYPFWDNCYGNWSHFTGDLASDMTLFVDYVEMRYTATKQMYPSNVVLLGETGHPSGGTASCAGGAVANRYNTVAAQQEFLRQLALRTALRGFLFEAFDEPWKGGAAHVESNWGVYYSTRAAKPNLPAQLASWLSK